MKNSSTNQIFSDVNKENNSFLSRKIMTPSLKSSTNLTLDKVNTNINNKGLISTVKLRNITNSTSANLTNFPISSSVSNKISTITNTEPAIINIKDGVAESKESPKELHDSNLFDTPRKSKRTFNEIQKERKKAKNEIQNLISEISTLYDETDHDSSLFMHKFEKILNFNNNIDYSKLIPKSLNSCGSCLLENSKFYILYIKYKSFNFKRFNEFGEKITLDDFILLIDDCLMYDQSDLKLIYKFFINYVGTNYKNEEIKIKFVRNGINNDSNEIGEKDYKYILENPETFFKYELNHGNFKNKDHEKSSTKFKFGNEEYLKELKRLEMLDLKPKTSDDTENEPNNLSKEPNEIKLIDDIKISLPYNYYDEIILRNKKDLEIEKTSFTCNKINNIQYLKIHNGDKFSFELAKKNQILNSENELIAQYKSKSHLKPKRAIISEIDEEKTAVNILDEDEEKNNRNIKKIKKYQSDKKQVKNEFEDGEDNKELETNKRGRSKLKNKSIKKTKSKIKKNKKSIKRSLSVSAKESEEEAHSKSSKSKPKTRRSKAPKTVDEKSTRKSKK